MLNRTLPCKQLTNKSQTRLFEAWIPLLVVAENMNAWFMASFPTVLSVIFSES